MQCIYQNIDVMSSFFTFFSQEYFLQFHVCTNRTPSPPPLALFDVSSSALDDLFDAGQLLVKENTIRGLSTQASTLLKGLDSLPQENEVAFLQICDELFDQFHVPCENSDLGCSSSDGQSHRLVSGH